MRTGSRRPFIQAIFLLGCEAVKIKIKSVLLLLFAAAVFSGCAGETEQPVATAEPVAVVTAAPTPIPTAEPTPEPTPTPGARIELSGGEEIDWPCGVPFSDPGFVTVGKTGADMTEKTEVSGRVICWKCGDYVLEYCFTDDDGEQINHQRTVHVVPVALPEIVQEEKVIYLSFDDGPCENTREVLEILEKYDAKATFVVITSRTKFLDILPEIKDAGHSVGIHANKHSIERLYTSERTFFEDFMTVQEIVHEYTGEYAQISRFPGGSRTANGYLGHKMENGMMDIKNMLADMGIRYYDWNVQTEASKSGSSKDTVDRFTTMVPGQTVPVSLQHDTRAYSVRALEEMLQWGIENGYTFKAMDNTVPEVHFEPEEKETD